MNTYAEKLKSFGLVVTSVRDDGSKVIVRGGTKVRQGEEIPGIGLMTVTEHPFAIRQEGSIWKLQCNTHYLETFEGNFKSFDKAVEKVVEVYVDLGFLSKKITAA
jgi:hypothetical protein